MSRNDNDLRDRTVPDDENYYAPTQRRVYNDDNIVVDNQRRPSTNYQQPIQDTFQSETINDFDIDGFNSKQRPSRERNNNNNNGNFDRKNNRQRGKKSRKKRAKRHVVLIIIILIILLIIGSITIVLSRVNYDEKESDSYSSSTELKSDSMVKNVLLIGVDARSDEDDSSSRSDTMMLISLDVKHHCIKTTSFLRDTWVYIPSLGYEQRLNAACSSGGYSNVCSTIEYNFGVKIDNYVVADFDMFQTLVDSLGGVDVDVTEEEANEVTSHPKRYGNVTLESGENTLTGEQALAYCRIRKIDTDFQRTKRQRTVMNAIIKKAKHSLPTKLYRMAFNSAPYIETDMTKSELVNFVSKAGLCMTGSMYQAKVPFDGTWSYATISGNSVISIDVDENKADLIDFIYNKTASELKAEQESEESND